MDTIELANRLYEKAKSDYRTCIKPHEGKELNYKIEGIVECIIDEYEDTIHAELSNLKQLDSLIADLYSVVNEDLKAAAKYNS